jgi:hypothetical protein
MRKPVYGIDVYKSPEFKALCDKFGFDLPEHLTDLKITIPCAGLLRVSCEYIVAYPKDADDCVELKPQGAV